MIIADMDGVEHLQVVGLSKIDFDKLNSELIDKNEDKMDIINKYMDYRLKKVKHKNEVGRDALNIARLMGLDECIIKRCGKDIRRKIKEAEAIESKLKSLTKKS